LKQAFDDYSLLEYFLARLEAGENLESILAQFPDKAGKLRPLLTAALKAHDSGAPLRIPASAQIDSRTRFLAEANRLQKKQPGFLPHLRFAGAAALVVFIFIVGLFGTGLASAKAVPGEALYPVKRAVERAQLALTIDQVTRLNLEEEFDRRRVSETETLTKAGSLESVTLAGPLNESTDQTWTVGGVQLNLTPDQEAVARSLSGSYIEVKGQVRSEGDLDVEDMELRLFNFSGTLDAISENEWLVSGVKVLVMENTQITGKPKIGKKVELTTLHYNEEYFLALSVKVTGGASDKDQPEERNQNDGKGNTQPLITETSEVDQEGTPTLSSTPEPKETEETDKPEPTIKQETTDDDKQVETPTPHETQKPTEDHGD